MHVASCAYPRDAHYDSSQGKWISDASQDWTSKASEGTVVDVYEDCIDIRAISFKSSWRDGTGDGDNYITRYQPAGIYRIPVSAETTATSKNTRIVFSDGSEITIEHPDTGEALDNNLLIRKGLKVNAYNWAKYPKEVFIGANVTSIGHSVFYSCHELTSVTIQDGVTSIEDQAFIFCDGITSLTIPNSVTSIGNDAFSSCSGLSSVMIPNSVRTIGNCAF